MQERQAERFVARPGLVAEFTPKATSDSTSATLVKHAVSRVRDLSVLDCGFDLEGPTTLKRGDRGMFSIGMKNRLSTIVGDATVTRVWKSGAALRFEMPYNTEPYFGEPARDAFAGHKAYERKTQLALIDITRLSAEIGRLKSVQTRLFMSGLLFSLVAFALGLIARSAALTSMHMGVVRMMPAIIVTICAWMALRKMMACNSLEGFVTLVRRQVERGSFMRAYQGWDQARLAMKKANQKKRHGNTVTAAPASTLNTWTTHLEKHISLEGAAISVCYLALYLVAVGTATMSFAGALQMPGQYAAITAGGVSALSLILPTALFWMAMQAIAGRWSAMASLKSWEAILAAPTAPARKVWPTYHTELQN